MKRRFIACISLAAALASCTSSPPPAPPPASSREASALATAPATVRLTVIGTSDLHGHVEALPVLGGFLKVLREDAAAAHGAVLVVDAGDMFQGTLESNLAEGQAVVAGYDALGYDAAAIGNHEFDYGPVGPHATPRDASDDPRGALRARAAEARFPFLAANVVDGATRAPVAWPHFHSRVVVERAGVRIGVLGVTSADTPKTTIADNLVGLTVEPPLAAITREAQALRAEGADVVVALAHAGGRCKDLSDPHDVASCDPREEIMRVLEKLPAGLVDVVVAGHTHQAMAHVVGGVPVIQSYATGKAFGRVDLTFDRAKKRVVATTVHPPEPLAEGAHYEGHAIAPDAKVAEAIAPYVERARARKAERLGVRVEPAIRRAYDEESAEGNLFADLLRAAAGADVALVNGGGLRADIPAGDLTYGALFEAMPFDNRIAVVRMTGGELRALVERNLAGGHGIFSLSGVRVTALCDRGELRARLHYVKAGGAAGGAIPDDAPLELATSDFLASGGDDLQFREGSITLRDTLMRDAFEEGLRARKGTLRGDDPALLDPKSPRIRMPGRRPIRCSTERRGAGSAR